MNDIAIDVDTKRAYISDSKRGRIVVYDSKSRDSWTIQHPATLADNLAVSFQTTLNYQITVPVLLIFPGQNTLWYSNFFVVLLFIPMKMLLRYFYLLWYFY